MSCSLPKQYAFNEYEAWFEGELKQLDFGSGIQVCGPECETTGTNPEVAPWITDFAVIFPDKKYVRVMQRFGETQKQFKGAGKLVHFAYHYGDFNGVMEDGYPEFIDQADLRIDREAGHPDHIHYGGENHIPVSRTPGLDHDSITPFDFLKAVMEYRQNGGELTELLKFKVTP